MRRRVSVNHSAATAETVNHHRLPRFAAITPHDIADTCSISPGTTVSRPFLPISLASAPAEGTTAATEISAATPHPLARDFRSMLIRTLEHWFESLFSYRR
jgi:hypothetical protein